MVAETVAPFPFGVVTRRRGESDTAVQVSVDEQLLAVRVKLPVTGANVPAPLPIKPLEGEMENVQEGGGCVTTANGAKSTAVAWRRVPTAPARSSAWMRTVRGPMVAQQSARN